MTMYKEIKQALKEEHAYVTINNICKLHRWTKDGLGCDVDRLRLEFTGVGHSAGWSYEIESRNVQGIIAEIEVHINDYLNMVAEELVKHLKAGYR